MTSIPKYPAFNPGQNPPAVQQPAKPAPQRGGRVRSFQQPASRVPLDGNGKRHRVDAKGRPLRKDGGFADPRDQAAYWDRVYPEFAAWGGGPSAWSTDKRWDQPSLEKFAKDSDLTKFGGARGLPPNSTPEALRRPAPQGQPTQEVLRAPEQQPQQQGQGTDWKPLPGDWNLFNAAAMFGVPARAGVPTISQGSTSDFYSPEERRQIESAIAQRVKEQEAKFGVKYNSAGFPVKVPQEQQPQQPHQGEAPSWSPPQDNRELWRQATQFGVHTRGPGWMEGSPQDPRNWSPEQREDYVNRVRNAQKAQEAKFGGKYNADGYFVRDRPQQAAEAQPESPWGQPGQSPWAQAPSRDFNYQPAFNAQGQAVNSANVMGRLAAESRYTPNAGSADGNRATSDLAKSMLMENAAHGRRGLEATNAEQNMKEQAARSEAMQQALGNQTRMYSDATNRATDQMSLASQIQQAMMESRNRFRQAMMGS